MTITIIHRPKIVIFSHQSGLINTTKKRECHWFLFIYKVSNQWENTVFMLYSLPIGYRWFAVAVADIVGSAANAPARLSRTSRREPVSWQPMLLLTTTLDWRNLNSHHFFIRILPLSNPSGPGVRSWRRWNKLFYPQCATFGVSGSRFLALFNRFWMHRTDFSFFLSFF